MTRKEQLFYYNSSEVSHLTQMVEKYEKVSIEKEEKLLFSLYLQ